MDGGCWADVWYDEVGWEACDEPADPSSPLGLCSRHDREVREGSADVRLRRDDG